MRVLWACPLVEEEPNVFSPRILWLQNTNPTVGGFPLVWSTTDAIRVSPFAIGAAELTLAQLTALQADGQVVLLEETRLASSLWFKQFKDLTAVEQVAAKAFCDRIGQPRPSPTEVLQDLLDRLIGTIELKNVSTLLTELATVIAARL